jgi:hypothetical protein
MEQRRLRLGDILDDYCPRERRVTNHAVVAMIEEDVKQTRCTTCEAEHPYKGARVPRRRTRDTPGTLYKEVLAGMPEYDADAAAAIGAPARAATPAPSASDGTVDAEPAAPVPQLPSSPAAPPIRPALSEDRPAMQSSHDDRSGPASGMPPAPPTEGDEDTPQNEEGLVDGPVHRRLIRATLPRLEGQKEVRQMPEFTVRHAPPRGNGNGHGGQGNFRGERMRMRGGGSGQGQGLGQGGANGNRGNGGARFNSGGGNRPGGAGRPAGRGGQSGFRNGNSGPNGKRGRGSRG